MTASARIRGVLAPVVTSLKLTRCPHSFAATLAALPSMSLSPKRSIPSFATCSMSRGPRAPLKLVRSPRSLDSSVPTFLSLNSR